MPMQIFGGLKRCIMGFVQVVNAIFFFFFFFGGGVKEVYYGTCASSEFRGPQFPLYLRNAEVLSYQISQSSWFFLH